MDRQYWAHGVYQPGELEQKTYQWGWELTNSMSSSAEGHASARAVFKAIYGEDLSQIPMKYKTWEHKKQVTSTPQGPEGISGVLEPTMAEYANIYLPGTIVALNIKSPRSSGPEQKPPVVGPYPALQYWSDIAFLQYVDLFCNDALENVLEPEVYNPTSKQAVNAIRHTIFSLTDDLSDVNYPPFPGLEIEINTKAYNALLAIPNGKSVVQLLSQNRETLGSRCVGSIRVWYDPERVSDAPTIWYRIQDAPCGSPGGELANDPEKLTKALQEEFKDGLVEES